MAEVSSIFELGFLSRLAINAISLCVLLRFVYYRDIAQREVLGGLMLFGNGVFIVTALLHSVEISMGFAFGLFAVFSMLRYRTEALELRDMMYLFVSIVIALMCAVSNLSIVDLLTVNGLVCLIAFICETSFLSNKTSQKQVLYEKIDLITPDKKDELFADLEARIGFKVEQVEIGNVDFLRDTVSLKVYYFPKEPKPVLDIAKASSSQVKNEHQST